MSGEMRSAGCLVQPKGEHAPVSNRALDGDTTLLELGQQSRDGETESGAAQLPVARLIDPEKSVEDELEMLRRDPWSRVLHRHADHASILPETEANLTLQR